MDLQALIADIKANNSWIHAIPGTQVTFDYGVDANGIQHKIVTAQVFYKDLNGILQPQAAITILLAIDTTQTPEVETATLVQQTLDAIDPTITPPLDFIQKMQQARDALIAVKQVFSVKRIDLDNIGQVAIVEAEHPHEDNILLPNAPQRQSNFPIKYRASLDDNGNVQYFPLTPAEVQKRIDWVTRMVAAGIDPNNPAASWGAGEQP